MMGNEKSQPAGLTVDETMTEVTENWSLHGATYAIGSIPKISVFISNHCSPSIVTPLDKFTKNIMIYRHPCILKYIASWRKGNKFHLATEQVQPLAQVLPSQTSLQICVGLQNVLKALVFLHDSGAVSHNNVCRASIYVTQGGSWKLGGFEYLCRFAEMSSSYLQETRATRYEPAVAPDEAKHLPQPLSAIDCYAFGVLALEVLDKKSVDDVPGMDDFLGLCRKSLQNKDAEARPTLSSLLSHPFFSHTFLSIHNFLVELAIKPENEKKDFFRNLTEDLRGFPEVIVASQLGSLLLSRIVLLDPTAQTFLLPSVFVPRSATDESETGGTSLFSENTFQTHMVPRLLPLFCVRDVQIRLILLSHFAHYCHLFSQVHLQSRILPELLVGIKDTDDTLVSTTLRALADLVPLLGGATVIGGKRSKLFADGKPKVVKSRSKVSCQKEEYKTKDINLYDEVEGSGLGVVLPERPSPDGGEYVPTSSGSEDEAWPDWEYTKGGSETSTDLPTALDEKLPDPAIPSLNATQNQHSRPIEPLESDIKQLKIQQKPKGDDYEEIFRDMEPVISLPQIVHVKPVPQMSDKFAPATELSEEEGWHEDFGDWSATDEEIAVNS